MSAIRPAKIRHQHHLNIAIERLKDARDLAIDSGCPRLAKKIRSALKSADGARRHLEHRMRRTSP